MANFWTPINRAQVRYLYSRGPTWPTVATLICSRGKTQTALRVFIPLLFAWKLWTAYCFRCMKIVQIFWAISNNGDRKVSIFRSSHPAVKTQGQLIIHSSFKKRHANDAVRQSIRAEQFQPVSNFTCLHVFTLSNWVKWCKSSIQRTLNTRNTWGILDFFIVLLWAHYTETDLWHQIKRSVTHFMFVHVDPFRVHRAENEKTRHKLIRFGSQLSKQSVFIWLWVKQLI